MKAISLAMFLTVLLTGCPGSDSKLQVTSKSLECKSNLSKWLRDCTSKMAENQSNKIHMFNGIGSNDAKFIPKDNPAEEIFQKCQSIQPLSAKDVSAYKKCLEKCIQEMKSINRDSTRKEVNKIFKQNGGISSPQAAIYSHPICEVLKVRVEFSAMKDETGRAKFDENDKVLAVSIPYLGLFSLD